MRLYHPFPTIAHPRASRGGGRHHATTPRASEALHALHAATHGALHRYDSGVYQVTSGSKRLGLHAVKVLGYGNVTSSEGETVKYWLCENSWGKDWGEDGFFRIATGQCGFEESVFTATPCVEGESCI